MIAVHVEDEKGNCTAMHYLIQKLSAIPLKKLLSIRRRMLSVDEPYPVMSPLSAGNGKGYDMDGKEVKIR